MIETRRSLSADPQSRRRRLAERVRERRAALLENLLRWATKSSRSLGSRSQARVVDRGHHGLAGTGRGDEQIAVPPAAGKLDLFEEPFLKRFELDLDWAQGSRCSVLGHRGPSTKLLGSNGTKSPLAQYDSKTAAIFATTSGLRTPDTRTFHSRPVTIAEWVRFDDPMYAVE